MGDLMGDIAAALQRPEELHPELSGHIAESVIGPVIKHLLLFVFPHIAAMNPLINRAFTGKQADVAEALRSQRWDRYLWLH